MGVLSILSRSCVNPARLNYCSTLESVFEFYLTLWKLFCFTLPSKSCFYIPIYPMLLNSFHYSRISRYSLIFTSWFRILIWKIWRKKIKGNNRELVCGRWERDMKEIFHGQLPIKFELIHTKIFFSRQSFSPLFLFLFSQL